MRTDLQDGVTTRVTYGVGGRGQPDMQSDRLSGKQQQSACANGRVLVQRQTACAFSAWWTYVYLAHVWRAQGFVKARRELRETQHDHHVRAVGLRHLSPGVRVSSTKDLSANYPQITSNLSCQDQRKQKTENRKKKKKTENRKKTQVSQATCL